MVEPGDFSWADPESRRMLEDAYEVITKLGYWEWLSTFEPGSGGFMWSNDPTVHQIFSSLMDNHSIATMGLTMRHMHCIAQHGWDPYRWVKDPPKPPFHHLGTI